QAIVEQPGDDKALPTVEFDLGLDTARRQRGYSESLKGDAIGIVEGTDFGSDLQADGAALCDDGQEIDADAKLAGGHRDGTYAGASLQHRKRELAAGHEAGLLAIDRHHVGLGQNFQQPLALERLDGGAQVDIAAEEEYVEGVGKVENRFVAADVDLSGREL